jgi:hypothetical protein
MRLGSRRTTLADLTMFDDAAIIQMWLEGGYTLPLHLRGLCDWHGDCPHCRAT